MLGEGRGDAMGGTMHDTCMHVTMCGAWMSQCAVCVIYSALLCAHSNISRLRVGEGGGDAMGMHGTMHGMHGTITPLHTLTLPPPIMP